MSDKIRVIFSMAIFGTIAVFVRNVPLSSAEIAFWRAAIAAICIVFWQKIQKKPLRLSNLGGDLPLLFISGAAMGFNWILLFEAYNYTSVSIATLSYYFAPTLVMLACPLLFREKLSALQILCFVFSTAGLALVINAGGFSAEGTHIKGVAFGLAAATLYACVMLINKKIQKVSGINRTICQFAAAAIVLLPYVLLTDGFHIQSLNGRGWFFLMFVAIIHSGLAYCLYFSGIKGLKGQELALLSYVDPLVAIAVSFIFLHEPVAPIQLLGGAMILVFTLINELKPSRR